MSKIIDVFVKLPLQIYYLFILFIILQSYLNASYGS